MSSLFAFVSVTAFLVMLAFIFLARRKRPGASTKAWIAGAVALGSMALSDVTMSGAERAAQEAKETARVKAEQQAAANAAAARAAEAKKRQAEDAARAKAEAERRANESISESQLIVSCKDAVRQQLNLPNSAKFPGWMEMYDQHKAVIGPKMATWSAWVEAENNLGGRVRYDFVCIYDKASNTVSAQLARH